MGGRLTYVGLTISRGKADDSSSKLTPSPLDGVALVMMVEGRELFLPGGCLHLLSACRPL